MRYTRSLLAKWPALIVLNCVIFLFTTSCGTERIEVKSTHSGRDYINGIFFAQGPVAEKISELNGNFDLSFFVESDSLVIEINKVKDQIINELPQDFLIGFKEDMESGNHIVIQSSILDASSRIRELIGSSPEFDFSQFLSQTDKELIEVVGKRFNPREVSMEEMKDALDEVIMEASIEGSGSRENLVSEQQCVAGPAVAAVAAVVGAVVYVLFVLEAVAFWTDIGVDWDDGVAVDIPLDDKRVRSSLLQEQIVNSIATNFSE